HGGKELKVNSWGRKELAYLMDKQRFGTYVCFNYSSEEGGIVKELASQLRITESVLRFQTHRLNDRSRKFKGRTSSGKGESHSEAA
ncbi:MAG: 30S ribosomal protein S6, partial [Bdellovibrionales bacterium]|nr:30S ribosomal protein S6 [Bdellovibrionales bacterium]